MDDDRLYRGLDQRLPHKTAVEIHLENRLGELFDLEYDLVLHDVTSTCFEGQANRHPQAQRRCSRDRRSDCKQVCIGLVVSRSGMPFGLEVFAGNRTDVTTVSQIVQTMESRYGQANRIWVMDRGMVSDDQMTFLRREGRRYIVGTPPSMLKEYEQALLSDDWPLVRESLQVKLVDGLEGDKTFILCRSQDRREKEKAMHDRFEQ